jgi:hypothetical protein
MKQEIISEEKEEKLILAVENNDYDSFIKLYKENYIPEFLKSRFIADTAYDNSIDIFKTLIENININNETINNITMSLVHSANKGNKEIFDILIKLPIDPTGFKNKAIILAYQAKNREIIDVLWNIKSIKDTLEKDSITIYNALKEEDLQNKIEDF